VIEGQCFHFGNLKVITVLFFSKIPQMMLPAKPPTIMAMMVATWYTKRGRPTNKLTMIYPTTSSIDIFGTSNNEIHSINAVKFMIIMFLIILNILTSPSLDHYCL